MSIRFDLFILKAFSLVLMVMFALPTHAQNRAQQAREEFRKGVTPAVSTVIAPSTSPLSAPVRETEKTLLYRYTVPDSGKVVELRLDQNSSETIRGFSRKSAQLRVPDMCNRGALENFVRSIPAEVMAFKIAEGIEVGRNIGSDPQRLKTFYEQSLINPDTYLTFVGFMMANHGTTALFQALGWTANPCTKKVLRYGPTPAQMRFAKVAPYIGMSAGLIASSILGEALALRKDPDFQMCVSAHVSSKVTRDVELACERVFEEWTVSHKIQQYMPDIFGCLGAFALQHYIVGPMAAAVKAATVTGYNRIVPATLKTFTIMFKYGWILNPVGGFAVKVAGQVFFMVATHYITPPLKNWNDKRMQSNDIAEITNHLRKEVGRAKSSKWNWVPEKKLCDKRIYPAGPRYENGIVVGKYDCSDTKVNIPYLLDRHHQKMLKFRNYLLQGALDAHSKWQDYVMSFQSSYVASYNFYSWYIDQMSERKNNTNPNLTLFKIRAFEGIRVKTVTEKGVQLQNAGPTLVAAINKIDEYLSKPTNHVQNFGYSNIKTVQDLKSIQRGFKIVVTLKDISKLQAVAPELAGQLNSTPAEQRDVLVEHIMDTELEKSINLINDYLKNHPQYTDRKYGPIASPYYVQYARNNIFASLRLILGNPKPIPEGMAAISEFDNNPLEINQDLKERHPKKLTTGLNPPVTIKFPTMTDYLLYSMMCGPNADPNEQVKWQIYRKQTLPWHERFFQGAMFRLGMASNPDVPAARRNLVEMNRYAEDAKAPGFKLLFDSEDAVGGSREHKNQNMNKDLAMATFRGGITAEFRPPRITTKNLCEGMSIDQKGLIEVQTNPNFWVRQPGKKFNGVLPAVKAFTRADLLGAPGAERLNFQKWWVTNVDPAAMRAIDWFYADFDRVLNKEFAPAFHNKEFKDIKGVRVKYGVLESIKYDLLIYTGLVKQITVDLKLNKNNVAAKDMAAKFEASTLHFLRIMLGLSSKWARETAVLEAEEFLKRPYGGQLRDMDTRLAQKRVVDLYGEMSKQYTAWINAMATYAGVKMPADMEAELFKLDKTPLAETTSQKAKAEMTQVLNQKVDWSKASVVTPPADVLPPAGSPQEIIRSALIQIKKLRTEADTHFGMYNTISFEKFDHAPVEKPDSQKSEKDRDAETEAYLLNLMNS